MKRNLDTIAKKYIENRGFESILTKYKIKKILKLCKGNYALDLGCGVGLITKELSKVFRKVVAIDGSVKKIKIAKKFIKKPNVIFYNQMFNSFNPKEKFDTIVMSNILEHVDNPILLLKKSRNWLNSDGIIIATVPNAQAFHKKIGLHSGIIKNLFELTKEDIEKGHKRVYDRNKLIKDFEKSGFKIIESGGIFFKLLSNKQMEMLDPQIFDALYEIGKELPDYCSSVYVCASKL